MNEPKDQNFEFYLRGQFQTKQFDNFNIVSDVIFENEYFYFIDKIDRDNIFLSRIHGVTGNIAKSKLDNGNCTFAIQDENKVVLLNMQTGEIFTIDLENNNTKLVGRKTFPLGLHALSDGQFAIQHMKGFSMFRIVDKMIKWNKDVQSNITSDLELVHDQNVWITCGIKTGEHTCELNAFNSKTDHEVLWKYKTENASFCDALLFGENVLVAFYDDDKRITNVELIGKSDGKKNKSIELKGRIIKMKTQQDNVVFRFAERIEIWKLDLSSPIKTINQPHLMYGNDSITILINTENESHDMVMAIDSNKESELFQISKGIRFMREGGVLFNKVFYY